MRGVGFFGLSLALCLVSGAATACDTGYDGSRRLESEVLNYYDADVVFLAKIGEVRNAPRTDGSSPWLWHASYEVLEVYRGKPANDGLLVDADLGPHRERDGTLSPPSIPCMTGSVLNPEMHGRRVLVFGKKETGGDISPQRYRVIINSQQGGSQQVDKCAGDWCKDLLQRMRLYGKAEGVSLAPL